MKGQVTIFVILGLVILLIVGVMFTLSRDGEPDKILLLNEQSVRGYVEECLNTQMVLGLEMIGLQGGYIYPAEFPGFIDMNGVAVHYHHFVGYNLVPYEEDIEEMQISQFIEDFLEDCLDDFSVFEGAVTAGTVNAQTHIELDSVTVDLDYPVVLGDDEAKSVLNHFSQTVSVPLGRMLSASNTIVNSLIDDAPYLNYDVLNSIPFVVEMYSLPEGDVFLLWDSESSFSEEGYSFLFGSLNTDNSKPDLLNPGPQVLKFNENYNLQLNVMNFDDEGIVFSDNTNLFEVDRLTGMVTFVPKQMGVFDVSFTVRDAVGNTDTEVVRMEVKG